MLKKKEFWKFLLPSLLGVFLFVTPVQSEGNFTIPVAVAAKALQNLIGDYSTVLIFALIAISTAGMVLHKIFKFPFVEKNPTLKSIFDVKGIWIVTRLIGCALAVMLMFGIGPEMIIGDATGGLVIHDLIPTLVCIFLLAGLLLNLLVNYGLLDFIGSMLIKVMRPLFGLPGRSALICIASWLGDGSVGVLLTSKQYEEGFFSKREATVIATNFAAVSITFCLVVISQVNLAHMFIPFYLTVTFAGIVAAIILPRIPPLRSIPDEYCGVKQSTEDMLQGTTASKLGLQLAMEKAGKAPGFGKFVVEGVGNVLEMWLGTIPVILALGTISMVVAEYTPIFQWLGYVFVPLYKLLQIPEAVEASGTVIVGFADMFLPSVIASSFESDLTKFVVAATSVTQLIYLSETGSIIMGSKIPVSLPKLFLIFLLRTLITLPIIALIAHILF